MRPRRLDAGRIVAGLAAAARHGVLVKGGAFLEAPASIRAFAFDKTGTLTHGRPRVLEVVPLSGHDERELLERLVGARGAERAPARRGHSRLRRRAGCLRAARRGLPGLRRQRAPRAPSAGATFWVGSHRYLEERGQETPEVHERLEAMSQAGQTVVVVGNETHVCGLVAVADGVRPNARETLQELHRLGIETTVMLTGDNRGTAEAIGRETGVSEIRAELLPDDKVAAIEELVERYERSRWSATGSTTHRRWRARASASRWAGPAPTPPSRRPTSR